MEYGTAVCSVGDFSAGWRGDVDRESESKRDLELIEKAIPSCSGWTSDAREVVKAMVAAAGDLGIAGITAVDEDAVQAGMDAVRQRKQVLCDTAAVAAGLHVGTQRLIESASDEDFEDALVVVGERVDVLAGLVEKLHRGLIRPALVVATCPGFSGAAEAKQALVGSGVPYIVVEGTRGAGRWPARRLMRLWPWQMRAVTSASPKDPPLTLLRKSWYDRRYWFWVVGLTSSPHLASPRGRGILVPRAGPQNHHSAVIVGTDGLKPALRRLRTFYSLS